jgi:hypothetical protein
VKRLNPERKQQAAYAALRSFFDQEQKLMDRNLAGLIDLLKENKEKSTGHDLRAEASYIHDFYNSAENIFRMIAEELNGGVPRGESWHRLLLMEMKTEVAVSRMPVISENLYQMLDMCLRFRHLFRNSYGVFLDPVKTREIAGIVLKANKILRQEINSFLESMQQGTR